MSGNSEGSIPSLCLDNGTTAAPNRISVFPAVTSGLPSPLATIVGRNTGLQGDPHGVAVDAAGNIYAANIDGSVTRYAADATGNVRPTGIIAGSLTGLATPGAIAVDAAGDMFVANSGNNSITVYPAGASGNVSPIATIQGSNTGLDSPGAIAFH